MTENARQALIELLRVCEGRGITMEYTTDDDGIHISVDGEDIFQGHLFDSAQVSDALGEVIRGQG